MTLTDYEVMEFISMEKVGIFSFTELCERFNISGYTGRKILKGKYETLPCLPWHLQLFFNFLDKRSFEMGCDMKDLDFHDMLYEYMQQKDKISETSFKSLTGKPTKLDIDLTEIGSFNWNEQCIDKENGRLRIAMVYNVPEEINDLDHFHIVHFGELVHYLKAEERLLTLLGRLKEYDNPIIISSHNLELLCNDYLRPDCYFHYKEGKCTPFHRSTNKELRYAHNIRKMYRAGMFQ